MSQTGAVAVDVAVGTERQDQSRAGARLSPPRDHLQVVSLHLGVRLFLFEVSWGLEGLFKSRARAGLLLLRPP